MISREQLPQIPSESLVDFVKFLHAKGVRFHLQQVPVETLKPIQSQVNNEKVKSLMGNVSALKIPLVVSYDKYILDGHHRWVATKELDADASMKCIVCECEIEDLIQCGHDFEDSFTASVHESTTYSNTEHHMIGLKTLLETSLAECSLNEEGRCWSGYEPVPGKKAYAQGSCRKIGEASVALPIVKKALQ